MINFMLSEIKKKSGIDEDHNFQDHLKNFNCKKPFGELLLLLFSWGFFYRDKN